MVWVTGVLENMRHCGDQIVDPLLGIVGWEKFAAFDVKIGDLRLSRMRWKKWGI